ncbi:unnamed protein product [Kuraishia capsulata CBS 1993]|uniref:GDT1 family protein n=1 Tax=Kuraishia capsulata CBS 1993 TaxID=1382522 RepID=W6MLX2_9ASCO|nr:uncharacterized protein KUCA_T00003145001 [Kuraishia capsulata CBS 1993]CDK27168.1 unnamed protein product [Kuraishia capsulata CBS 1993]
MRFSKVLVSLALISQAIAVYPPPVGSNDGDVAITGFGAGAASGSDSSSLVSEKAEASDSKVSGIGENSGSILSSQKTPLEGQDQKAEGGFNAFLMSISMIIVSEIGDKTFLIAALMAMKSPRLVVFTAAFSSLAVMTVLSGVVGHTLPALIPQRLTQFLAGILFIVFGVKLFNEGLGMSKELGVGEEMAEVEEEIASSAINSRMNASELGKEFNEPAYKKVLENATNLVSFVLSPRWVQVFVMTFLGEWGDRSQIATIAMAAGSDYWFVILGAIIGHGLCTAAAVIGGKLLASKISMRNVTLGGAVAFFVFSILYFYEASYNTGE